MVSSDSPTLGTTALGVELLTQRLMAAITATGNGKTGSVKQSVDDGAQGKVCMCNKLESRSKGSILCSCFLSRTILLSVIFPPLLDTMWREQLTELIHKSQAFYRVYAGMCVIRYAFSNVSRILSHSSLTYISEIWPTRM